MGRSTYRYPPWVEPLGATDANAVLGAADRLASATPPDFADACSLLSELIPCTSVSFNDMALASGDFRFVIVPDTNEATARRLKPAYDRYFHQHPLIARAREEPGARALRFCDVPGGDAVIETDLFKHFYEPFGIRYQMVLQLPAPPDVVVGYALNRSESEGEFSERDVTVFSALAAYLTLHHRVVKDLAQAQAMAAEAERDGWFVVMARSDGAIEHSSATAVHRELAEGGLVPPDVAALLPVGGTATGRAEQHDVLVGEERWRCVVQPVVVGPTVLLMRRLGGETADVSPLVDRGLTPRQAEVALTLARTGATNSQLARSLRISEGTLKKHLEVVFRVLGTESRAAASVAVRDLVDPPGRR